MADPTPTRTRLLEAAVEALLEVDLAALLTAVGTRDIARRAGVSVGTLFHHFGSTSGLAEALLERLYDPRRPAPPEVEVEAQVDPAEGMPTSSEFSVALHRAEYVRLLADPEQRLRVGLAGLGGDGVREAYARYLRGREGPLLSRAQALFGGWGREPRPPVDWPSFLALHVSLVSGVVSRARCDPDAIDAELFARAASALSMALLRTVGETRDLDARLGEMDYHPVRSRAGERGLGGREQRRDRLLRAALELVAEHGYDQVGLRQVARAAGLSTGAAYGVFADKDALAAAVVAAQTAALPDVVAGVGGSGRGAFERSLDEIARALHGCGPFLPAYVAALVTGRAPAGDDPVRRAVSVAVGRAVDDGLLAPRAAGADLVSMVVGLLLQRVLGHPLARASGPLLASLVLDGLARGADAP